MSPTQVVLVVALALVGGVIQGGAGFGLGMLTAPVLVLVDTAFVPGPVLIATVPLACAVALRERRDIDRRGIGLALIGRVPGTLAGSAALAALASRWLPLGVAVAVLAAVALSVLGWRIPRTRGNLIAAGAASGFMGTTVSIGGPPMAIAYQDESGPTVRSTLSAFFLIGTTLSIATLAVAGQIGRRELDLSLVLAPGVLVGYAISAPAARYVDGGRTRPVILGISAVAACVIVLHELV